MAPESRRHSSKPFRPVLDWPPSNYLYWSGERAIGRARPRRWKRVDPDFIGGLDHVGTIAVDSGHVYWMNTPEGIYYSTIGRAATDGSD